MGSPTDAELHAADAPPRTAGRPREFDAAPVLAAARSLLEAGGQGALTMRALSQVSGATVTSIYRNLGDRDAVLDAVLDSYAAEIRPPTLPADPAEQILAVLTHIYDVLGTQPWTLDVIARSRRFGASAMWYAEAFFRATDALGLDGPASVRAYRQLWAYTLGALLTRTTGSPDEYRPAKDRERIEGIAEREGYPRVLRFLEHGDGFPREAFLEGLREQVRTLASAR